MPGSRSRKRGHEGSGVQIAGRLAAREHDPHVSERAAAKISGGNVRVDLASGQPQFEDDHAARVTVVV